MKNSPCSTSGSPDPAVQAYVHMRTAHVSALHVVFDGFNLIDVIFTVLGLGTAFRVGRGEKKEAEQVVHAGSADLRWQGTPSHEHSHRERERKFSPGVRGTHRVSTSFPVELAASHGEVTSA